MIPIQQLGWMAGILDLKGRIIIKNNKQRQKGSPQIVLMVETRFSHVIRELSSMTGTNPELQVERKVSDIMRRGCAEHCPEQHFHVDYPIMPAISRWTITGTAAAVVLYNVLPFIKSDKSADFELAMRTSFEHAKLFGQGSGMTLNSIERLANLGWQIPPHIEMVLDKRNSTKAIEGEIVNAS